MSIRSVLEVFIRSEKTNGDGKCIIIEQPDHESDTFNSIKITLDQVELFIDHLLEVKEELELDNE